MKELKIDYDRVRDLEDAFNDYQPEDDLYLIADSDIAYDTIKVGDIVYVSKYRYKDGKEGKNHLFVLVGETTFVSLEFFAMLISSRIEKIKYKSNIGLTKSNLNNLNKDSIVKTDALYKIPIKNIIKVIGEVSKEDLEKYITMYNEYKKEQ